MLPLTPLSPERQLARGVLALLAALVLGFLMNLVLLSGLQQAIAQIQLRGVFAGQLEAGTAPVSEGTFEDVLLSDGDPVARIEIPGISLDQIVVQGTAAGALKSGPGHRRDSALPGQPGFTVIMGRAAAYGGPFARIQELAPGEAISLITGQGEHVYRVIGVRYAGDLAPPLPKAGQSRLVLETARGLPFMPSGVIRVDAELVSPPQPTGLRQTTFWQLPRADKEMASDYRTVWALVFALQFFVLAGAAATYSLRLVGRAKTWLVFAPVLLLAGLLVADQLILLLPNLM
ncbi:MAG: sortase [Micrococcales bacterium]|nr:sortase [Micrococcales bacterium]